ncbi:14751_t:CDS:2 [Cetraspora pellucida]|uniref:14751_t:CDS:1 n=1 Tax=Cetraspora pellucida TaxID=1433469 RepID=A0ACA9LB26_9GLOM|nr:14751_t:CDS:2 [Cetraspora pellucida]
MSKNADYEKYYKNALKKFTEIANETNPTTTASMSLSSSKMKATPFSIPQDHNSLTNQSYLIQHKHNSQNSTANRSYPIKQSKNSVVNQSQIISQQKSNVDWPEETDGWVYIKNSDDSKADFDALDIKVEGE